MFGASEMRNKLLNKYMIFLSERKNLSKERHLLKKIEEGFKNDEFKMHLQFIVDNKTKKIVSSEALSRWENSSGEVILPGAYIGLMKKSGLIVKFDCYMFEMVCKKLSEWKNSVFNELTISCNITRITISEKGFVSKIKEIADKYDFDRSKLLIEITEDSLEKNMDVAKVNIIDTKALGFCIALDDLGSGYATLSNLCDYSVDIVKIDRNILLQTETDVGKELFLNIIAKVHELGLKVVCEGVETEAQNTLVLGSNCDYIQGWYYSKALPESKAEEFYKEYMKNF
jgi:EAL domain-containing protein (putative c-di-GMP-specific phosphodiesterase class I)